MVCFATFSLTLWTLIPATIAGTFSRDSQKCTLAPSPPSIAQCGIRGSVEETPYDDPGYFSVGEPVVVKSAEACAFLCNRLSPPRGVKYFKKLTLEDYCIGFEFNTEDGLCQLRRVLIRNTHIRGNRNSSHTYYDLGCFSCPQRCPQDFGRQLLDNGNFERKLLGPWTSEGGILSYQGGRSSSKAWKCKEFRNRNTPDCLLRQAFTICPNTTYGLRLHYKSPRGGPSSRLLHMQPVGEFGYVDLVSLYGFSDIGEVKGDLGEDEWKEGTMFFHSDQYGFELFTAGILINFTPLSSYNGDFGSPSGYFVDRVSASSIDPSLLIPNDGTQSILVNGDFETGHHGPWKMGNFIGEKVNIVSPGINSKFAANITGSIQQTFPTKPGAAYRVDLDGHLPQDSEGYATFYTSLTSGHAFVADSHNLYGGTRTISTVFIAYANTTTLELLVDGDPTLVDNVSVRKLDNPLF